MKNQFKISDCFKHCYSEDKARELNSIKDKKSNVKIKLSEIVRDESLPIIDRFFWINNVAIENYGERKAMYQYLKDRYKELTGEKTNIIEAEKYFKRKAFKDPKEFEKFLNAIGI